MQADVPGRLGTALRHDLPDFELLAVLHTLEEALNRQKV